MTMVSDAPLVLGVGAVVAGLVWVLRSIRAFRRSRAVACPADGGLTAVRVTAGLGARAGLFGLPALRLESCARWPERAGCRQDCLGQLAAR